MGEAIGGLLPFAVGVAVSPFPIVGMILMLLTPRARSNGFSFLLGWVAGVAIAGAVFLTIFTAIGVSDDDEPATWTYWLKLVLGLALLILAVRQWRHRPRPGDDVPMPKWMSALEDFTPGTSVGLAVLLSAVNPKNLIFVIGGAAVVVQADVGVGGDVVAWVVFTLIASIGVAAPLGIFLFLGDRAAGILDNLKTWMATNNTAMVAVLLLVIGVKLLGDALAGLF
jgi:hypothetical protein